MTASNFPWTALAEEVGRLTEMSSAFDWLLQSIAESGARDADAWADMIREIRARETRFLQFVVDTVSFPYCMA